MGIVKQYSAILRAKTHACTNSGLFLLHVAANRLIPLPFLHPLLPLRCLPLNRRQWAEHLQEQRTLYARFVNDFILEPAKKVTRGGSFDNVECGNQDKTTPEVVEVEGGTSGTEDDPTAMVIAADVVAPSAGSSPGDVLCTAKNGMERADDEEDAYRERHSRTRSESSVSYDAEKPATVASVLPTPSTATLARSRRSSSGNQGLRPTDDDPLSDKESSEWAALWSDKELMQAINQDVVRTLPFLAFYAGGGGDGDGDARSNDSTSKTRSEKHRLGRERHRAIARILFVHAKLNPAESYTQGMNEIVGTLFFVMGNDPHEEWSKHAEADTFFCFTNLMAEIRDVFIQSLDESESGLQGKMEAFSRTLQQHDPELANHMVSGGCICYFMVTARACRCVFPAGKFCLSILLCNCWQMRRRCVVHGPGR